MADEIVYVTITADVVEIVEVESYIPSPVIVDVQITGNEGFTFVTDITPVTTMIGHTWYKPSTNQSFVWVSNNWQSFPAFPELAVPTGTIISGGWSTAPVGCAFLNGQTLVNGAINYPLLASYYPSWVSGNNLVLPDIAGMTLLATNGTAGTRPITSNSKTVAIGVNNLPLHTHAVGTLGTGNDTPGHVHYLGSVHGSVGGWVSTAGMGNPDANHYHGFSISTLDPGPYNDANLTTGHGGNTIASYSNNTGTVSAWHTHAISGYSTGAHQNHSHPVTGATGNNTSTATALPYDTTPAHMLVKFAVKL